MIKHPQVEIKRGSSQSLCHYRNLTPQLQVVRVCSDRRVLLERVVFPGERWLFEATLEAELEIYTKTSIGITVLEKWLCSQQQVKASSVAACA